MQFRYIVMTSKSHRKKLCPILKNPANTLNTAAPAMAAPNTATVSKTTTMATMCAASIPIPAVNTMVAVAATAADRAGCLAMVACAWYCCN